MVRTLKEKRDKKKNILLKPEKAHKVIACPQPSEQNLSNKNSKIYPKKSFHIISLAPYRYMTFPRLAIDLFAKPAFQLDSVIVEGKSFDTVVNFKYSAII